MYTSSLRVAIACIGLSAFANAGTLFYPRQSAPCSDTDSTYCDVGLCCAPEATCLVDTTDSTRSQCSTTTTLPAPSTCLSSDLVQCPAFDHCCPTGQSCSRDSSGNAQCNGRRYPPLTEPACPTPDGVLCNGFSHCCFPGETCGADATNTPTCNGQGIGQYANTCPTSEYFSCTGYNYCCLRGHQCTLSTTGSPQCSENGATVPPTTGGTNPPTTGGTNPPTTGGTNPPTTGGNNNNGNNNGNGGVSVSVSRSTVTASAPASSPSDNAAYDKSALGAVGSFGVVALVAALMG